MISALSRIAWSWALDETPELFLGFLDIELRVAFHRLGQLVVAFNRRVVLEHVQDEPLLNRLLHAVAVKGVMPDRTVCLRVRVAEDLQRLVLGCGGECEVAGVGEQLARLHQAVDLILVGFLFTRFTGLGERLGHGRAGSAALARVSLIDDDGEAPPALFVADLRRG